jgi:hypothetical protein
LSAFFVGDLDLGSGVGVDRISLYVGIGTFTDMKFLIFEVGVDRTPHSLNPNPKSQEPKGGCKAIIISLFWPQRGTNLSLVVVHHYNMELDCKTATASSTTSRSSCVLRLTSSIYIFCLCIKNQNIQAKDFTSYTTRFFTTTITICSLFNPN